MIEVRRHPEWLREYAYRNNCVREFSWYGYDMRCGHEYVLVRQLNRDCSVTISYQTFIESKRFKPRLVVLDPRTGEELVKLSYDEWISIMFGYNRRKIFIVPYNCELRVKITGYMKGKEIRIVVGEETYERWMRLVRNRKRDWEEIMKELLTRAGF